MLMNDVLMSKIVRWLLKSVAALNILSWWDPEKNVTFYVVMMWSCKWMFLIWRGQGKMKPFIWILFVNVLRPISSAKALCSYRNAWCCVHKVTLNFHAIKLCHEEHKTVWVPKWVKTLLRNFSLCVIRNYFLITLVSVPLFPKLMFYSDAAMLVCANRGGAFKVAYLGFCFKLEY